MLFSDGGTFSFSSIDWKDGYSILNHVGYLMFSNDNVSKIVNLKSFTMFSCFSGYLGSCWFYHQIPSPLSIAGGWMGCGLYTICSVHMRWWLLVRHFYVVGGKLNMK